MNISEIIERVTRVGRLADRSDDELRPAILDVPREAFDHLCEHRHDVFGFLANTTFEHAFDLVRGLTICEIHRVSPFRGSRSLVKAAFYAIRQRPLNEWAEIADWVITHSDNPYIPFSLRATRSHWKAVRNTAETPSEIWRAVLVYEAELAREKADNRWRFQAHEEAATQRHVQRQSRVRAHLQSKAARSGPDRERCLTEMRNLQPCGRLKRIAEDLINPIGYYPREFAVVTDDELARLDFQTVHTLRRKLDDVKNGPWKALFLRLCRLLIRATDE